MPRDQPRLSVGLHGPIACQYPWMTASLHLFWHAFGHGERPSFPPATLASRGPTTADAQLGRVDCDPGRDLRNHPPVVGRSLIPCVPVTTLEPRPVLVRIWCASRACLAPQVGGRPGGSFLDQACPHAPGLRRGATAHTVTLAPGRCAPPVFRVRLRCPIEEGTPGPKATHEPQHLRRAHPLREGQVGDRTHFFTFPTRMSSSTSPVRKSDRAQRDLDYF